MTEPTASERIEALRARRTAASAAPVAAPAVPAAPVRPVATSAGVASPPVSSAPVAPVPAPTAPRPKSSATTGGVQITLPSPARMAATGASVVSFAAMVVAMGPLASSAGDDSDGSSEDALAFAEGTSGSVAAPVTPNVVVEVIPNYVEVPATLEELTGVDRAEDANGAVPLAADGPGLDTADPNVVAGPASQPVPVSPLPKSAAPTAAAPPATVAPAAAPVAPPTTTQAAPAPTAAAPAPTAPPTTAAPAPTAPPTTAAPAPTTAPPPPKSEKSG